MKKMRLFSAGNLFCCSGWLVAVLAACLALPRLCDRLFLKLPSVQNENWTLAVAEKKRELSARWRDTRPLVVMAGDSHVELGDWYGLFGGAFAVRNCGLSRAKIGDVANLVSAIADRNPRKIVLMCGVNNLGADNPVESCVKDYGQLISASQSLQPEKIIVLSVIPVRESALDAASRKLNLEISDFDRRLEILCAQRKAKFVDVSAAVADKRGALSPELTGDGLHLNRDGYRKIAAVLAPVLAETN
jgi:lysophospholipase L1-like esterase